MSVIAFLLDMCGRVLDTIEVRIRTSILLNMSCHIT